jgi:hypothetical protein
LALAAIAAVGVVAIVGSGGGVPACILCAPGVQEPTIELRVNPGSQGVQVGETAVFYAFATPNGAASGPLAYVWCKSPGGVGPCVEIPGSIDFKLVLTGLNLADNGSVFGVTVRGINATASAQGNLFVSNTPPVGYRDGEFPLEDWLATATAGAASAPDPRIERAETGGNPGAFRHITQQIPTTSLDAIYFSESRTAVYDPATQGAVYGIEIACDIAMLVSLGPDVPYYSIGVAALVTQGGRKYTPKESACRGSSSVGTVWTAAAEADLGLPRQSAEYFRIVDGPPCGAAEACPDFSAGASPLGFGYAVGVFVPYGAPLAPKFEFGVDNFKVTVWRR